MVEATKERKLLPSNTMRSNSFYAVSCSRLNFLYQKRCTLSIQSSTTTLTSLTSRLDARSLSTCSSLQNSDSQTARKGPRYDLLFCGTDNFALPVLQRLAKEPDLFNSIQVLTPPDAEHKWGAKRMRVSPVKELAQSLRLTTHSVPTEGLEALKLSPPFARDRDLTDDSGSYNNTDSHTVPLLVTASFGHYLPPSFLSRFPSRQVLNLHPSLLPKLRGAAPIQWAIARQISATGVSVQWIEGEGWDVGDVLGSESFSLPPDADYLSMEPVLAKLGSELLVSVIRNLERCSSEAKPQDHSAATKAPKLKRSHAEVRWNEWDSKKVDARSRGMDYMFPLSTTLVPSKSGKGIPTSSLRVLLPKVSVLKSQELNSSNPEFTNHLLDLSRSQVPFGTAILSEEKECLVVKCPSMEAKDGEAPDSTFTLESSSPCSFLSIHTLKTEGKQEKKAAEWFIGYKDRADEEGRLKFEFKDQVAK